MKAVVFTPNDLDPVHPRLKFVCDQLANYYEEVSIINYSKKNRKRDYIINGFFFWFFDLSAIIRSIKHIKYYDFIFIQDLRLLLLLLFVPRKRKYAVYETLDNGVHWHYYHLTEKYPVFKYLRFLIPLFSKIERRIAFRASSIIVNSDALYDYFGKKAEIVYYSSFFEDLKQKNNPSNAPALLYLGEFTTDKGAVETINLKDKLGIPLFVFGNIKEKEVLNRLSENEDIIFENKLSQNDLRSRLERLLMDHYLLGVSLIKPVHFSYATQEANKDIDYLSLGIPIIGNDRTPTLNKINAGCGFLYNDTESINTLVHDTALRNQTSETCLDYYRSHYAKKITEKKFADAINIK